MLGLRPPGLEFRILCLEDSVISIISPSSGGSPVHKGGLKPDSFHFTVGLHVTRCLFLSLLSYSLVVVIYRRHPRMCILQFTGGLTFLMEMKIRSDDRWDGLNTKFNPRRNPCRCFWPFQYWDCPYDIVCGQGARSWCDGQHCCLVPHNSFSGLGTRFSNKQNVYYCGDRGDMTKCLLLWGQGRHPVSDYFWRAVSSYHPQEVPLVQCDQYMNTDSVRFVYSFY